MSRAPSSRSMAIVVAGLLAATVLVSIRGVEAQSGGAILVNIRAGSSTLAGTVKVMTAEAEPREVAKGPSGRPISVPAGRYDVTITATELIDAPTQQLRDLHVAAGETVERQATFPSGTITLVITRGGRGLKNAELRFTRGGEELPGVAKVGEAFKISPGTYEAAIALGKGTRHTITGIQSYDGAKRTIPVEL